MLGVAPGVSRSWDRAGGAGILDGGPLCKLDDKAPNDVWLHLLERTR